MPRSSSGPRFPLLNLYFYIWYGAISGMRMAYKTFLFSLFILLVHGTSGQVTFVIESLPAATPGTDTIFITGTFNNWVPNDARYALKRQLNGQLAITLPDVPSKIEYKFTRGSWTKVETNSENKYTSNRSLESQSSEEKILVTIDNWLDLGGARPLNYIIFYFFACAFQGIVLCLFVSRIDRKDNHRFNSFVIFNALLTASAILMFFYETANQVWQSYFMFIFHAGFFCWTPLILFFLHSFQFGSTPSKLFYFFIPAVVVSLFIAFRILNVDAFASLSDVVLSPFTLANFVIITTGFLFNVFVTAKMFGRFYFLSNARAHHDPRSKMLRYIFWTSSIALLFVAANVGLLISGVHTSFTEDFNIVAVALSTLIFLQTYFLWRYPEIIKEERIPVLTEDAQFWSDKLRNFMKDEKPFKNAELSVSDLAEMLGAKPHVLSKIINDNYHKNFRDFVNTYRVEEFITLANTEKFRHFTFLALAQEVGFNSKSTFNLAFKKVTNQSPREYFKSKELSS